MGGTALGQAQSFDRLRMRGRGCRMVVGGKNEINNDAIALLKMRLPWVAAAFWGSRSSAMVYSSHVPR